MSRPSIRINSLLISICPGLELRPPDHATMVYYANHMINRFRNYDRGVGKSGIPFNKI